MDLKNVKSATKNEVAEFVKSIGGAVRYSGKTKTMFISHSKARYSRKKGHESMILSEMHKAVIDLFGYGLAFKLG